MPGSWAALMSGSAGLEALSPPKLGSSPPWESLVVEPHRAHGEKGHGVAARDRREGHGAPAAVGRVRPAGRQQPGDRRAALVLHAAQRRRHVDAAVRGEGHPCAGARTDESDSRMPGRAVRRVRGAVGQQVPGEDAARRVAGEEDRAVRGDGDRANGRPGPGVGEQDRAGEARAGGEGGVRVAGRREAVYRAEGRAALLRVARDDDAPVGHDGGRLGARGVGVAHRHPVDPGARQALVQRERTRGSGGGGQQQRCQERDEVCAACHEARPPGRVRPSSALRRLLQTEAFGRDLRRIRGPDGPAGW